MVVVSFYLHKSVQILLSLIVLFVGRRRHELSSLPSSWIRLFVFAILLDEDLPALVLVSELLVAHLDEHVVIYFVGSAALEFAGDPVLRGLG